MSNEPLQQLDLEVQYVAGSEALPAECKLHAWAQAAMAPESQGLEMVIRIVDMDESHDLNLRYRGKDKATNVLSFQSENLPGLDNPHLGDLVICAPLVEAEALQQGKPLNAHWAHLVVHGMLHLRGFDHQTDQQAREMEAMEVGILSGLGFADPYQPTSQTEQVQSSGNQGTL